MKNKKEILSKNHKIINIDGCTIKLNYTTKPENKVKPEVIKKIIINSLSSQDWPINYWMR